MIDLSPYDRLKRLLDQSAGSVERFKRWRHDRSPGALSNAYRDSTNARLDAIEHDLVEIKRMLNVLALGTDTLRK
jgi:hypothetical protein